MKFLIAFIAMFASASVLAKPSIKQINGNDQQIAVRATKNTTIGSQWIATTKSGSQCQFEVTQQSSSTAVMETGDCEMSDLRVGQRLEKSLFTSDNSTKTKSKPMWMKKIKGLSVIAFFSLADELPYTTQGQNITANSSNAFGFGGEYNYSLSKVTEGLPLSIVPGLTYEMTREIDSYSNGVKVTGAKPSFSLWTPYINGMYNIADSFGAFAGVNYSIPLAENFGDVKLKSQLGYQIGATARVTSSVALDGIYRWINFDGTSGVKDVSLDGFTLRGRYMF